MKDWRSIHLAQIEKEQRAIILEGATQEQFVSMTKAKKLEPGATFLWTIGICGPIGSAKKQKVA